jgi:thiol-disulfide isomerase/thioredoxin
MISLQSAVLALAVSGVQGETVLLDFYAEWCTPCKQMDHVVQQLSAKGYPVRKVDFDRHRDLAAKYGVRLLPTFLMLADGKVVDRVEGRTEMRRLERMFKVAEAVRPRSQVPRQKVPSGSPGRDMREAAPHLDPFSRRRGPLECSTGPRPPGHAPAPGLNLPPEPGNSSRPKTATEEHLIAVTARLRIEESDGHSCGSGTIIDARQGQALILSCGHIFRDSGGEGKITVDLFGPTPVTGIPGRLVCYDEKSDIGLVAIPTRAPLTVARVAPPAYRVEQGRPVYTAGCDNGRPPTVQSTHVTSLNRYAGSPNLQVAGMPVQGRSGGGLFSPDGLVIGVCNAADPSDQEGFYAALESIHSQLDEARLSFVYQDDAGKDDQSPLVAAGPPAMPRQMPEFSDTADVDEPSQRSSSTEPSPLQDHAAQLGSEERAAVDEIGRRTSEGAEVICIIRSRSNPDAPSEIIMLDRTSPAFLEQLAKDVRRRDRTRLTSLVIPHRQSGQFPAGPYHVQQRSVTKTSCPSGGRAATESSTQSPPWQPQWLETGDRGH